jgi:multisubunit Na+/H+ antiporter MnhC subunit
MAATTSDQATTANDAFVTVPGDRRSEVARTLAEPVPQALSLLASILSFAVAAAVTLLVGGLARWVRREPGDQ